MPLTPAVFHLMLALAEGERHGYAMMQEVERLTGGLVRLGPGTLYRSLQRMQVGGLIEECAERGEPEEDDERRRYYRLTPFGWQVAREEAHRLAVVVAVARARRLLPEATGARPPELADSSPGPEVVRPAARKRGTNAR